MRPKVNACRLSNHAEHRSITLCKWLGTLRDKTADGPVIHVPRGRTVQSKFREID
jgi:hypothetical protein